MTLWDFIDKHPFWSLLGAVLMWAVLHSVATALRKNITVKAEVNVHGVVEGDDPEGDEDEVEPDPDPREAKEKRKGRIDVEDRRTRN